MPVDNTNTIKFYLYVTVCIFEVCIEIDLCPKLLCFQINALSYVSNLCTLDPNIINYFMLHRKISCETSKLFVLIITPPSSRNIYWISFLPKLGCLVNSLGCVKYCEHYIGSKIEWFQKC